MTNTARFARRETSHYAVLPARLLAGIVVLAFAAGAALAADSPDGTLAEVGKAIKAVRISKGVAIELGSLDAATAIELARISQLRVYRVQDDAALLARDRQAVESAGLSALRVRIEAGPIESLELPRFAANVVVCTGWPDAKRLTEIGRIIQPRGWLFVLPASGTLAVEYAGKQLGQSGASGWLAPVACGAGVRVQRADLDGTADWTHYFRSPDNNRYSPDKLVKPPLRPLWYGEPAFPLGDLFYTQGLAAGGRLFLTDASPEDTTRARLTCLDAYNGVIQWERQVGGPRYTKVEGPTADKNVRMFQLPGRVMPGEMVATADKLYLTDSRDCLVLDPATGDEVARLKAPPPTDEENCWRFVACVEDMLIGCTSRPVPMHGVKQPTTQPAGGMATVFAIEAATGKAKWVRGGSAADELGEEFGPPLAIGDNRIFFRVGDGIVALDARTGQTAWKAGGVELPDRDTWWEGLVSHGWFTLYQLSIRTWGDKKRLGMKVFATADGKQVEQPPADPKQDGFFNSQEQFLGLPGNIRLGCNYGSAAGGMYFYRNNYFVEKPGTIITNPGNQVSYGGPRAGCNVGAVPANGLVYLLPNGLGCGCAAFHATMAYETVPATAGQPAGGPIVQTISTLPDEQQTMAAENDWPTYLADAGRTGQTRQDLTRPRAPLWDVRVGGLPTPCIAVGDSVYLGSTDECVYSLDAATGRTRWKTQLGGGIQAAPAYWAGRVYAGCDDGWIYCLSAGDGRLLWRLRAAESARKQMAFESLVSAWPVRQGVAVDNGQVFFTAGAISGQGIDACAADARTGRPLWRVPVGKSAIVPVGYIALTPDRVVLASLGSASIYHPVVLMRSDGSRAKSTVTHADFSEVRYVPGRDTDEPDYRPGFLVHGGNEGIQRGYRTGAGYCGRAYRNSVPYHLSPDAAEPVSAKPKDHPWFADGYSFLPVMTTDRVFLRSRGMLTALDRGDLFKYLDTKPPQRDAMVKWAIRDLPCGQPDWLIAAGAGDAVTLLAGGAKGITAVDVAGQVLWSVPAPAGQGDIARGVAPAVARGRIFMTADDGHVRALAVKD